MAGKGVFSAAERETWLKKLPAAARWLAGLLMLEHDGLLELRRKAEKEMLAEAGKHRAWRLVKSCPGLGEIRTAPLLPIVVTPYRFKNKRSVLGVRRPGDRDAELIGLGADAERGVGEGADPADPGPDRNANGTLKGIFKGAATTVIGQGQDEPLYRHYLRLLDGVAWKQK